MSDFFPKWTNSLPLKVGIGAALLGTFALGAVGYYFTPKYTRVGYKPTQPVAFSHDIHANQLQIDCRYCHNNVDKSWFSNVPAANTCMNCHSIVLKESPKLELVRQSYTTSKPIEWVQIHKVPDYVYFNHSVHVSRGISCVECHGQINHMDEVYHAKSLSMSFCLDCHRNPEQALRDPKDVYNLDLKVDSEKQLKSGLKLAHDWKVNASQNCSACHR